MEVLQGCSAAKTSAGNMMSFWKHVHFPKKTAPQCIVHVTWLSYCIAVLQTSLLQTCGHLTHRTSTRLTIPSLVSHAAACVSDQSPWHRRAATVSYHRVVWTRTVRCGWRHWSV